MLDKTQDHFPHNTRAGLFKAAIAQVEKLRLAAGYTQKELARRAGMSLDTYKRFIRNGGRISPEAARRLRGALMGEDFSHAPRLKHVHREKDKRKVTVWWSPDEHEELLSTCRRYGVGMRAMIHIAVRRLLEDAPPMNTIARVAREVGEALVREELARNPELGYILEMDTEVAREEGRRIATRAVPDTEKEDFPTRRLLRLATHTYDGAAENLYWESQEQEELEDWMEQEGFEELDP